MSVEQRSDLTQVKVKSRRSCDSEFRSLKCTKSRPRGVLALVGSFRNRKVQKSPGAADLLSKLVVVDAMLGKKQDAITEVKRAAEMLPIARDAVIGPEIVKNLVVVYAWTGELELSFEALVPLAKMPFGIDYGDLKLSPLWDPLRKDPRFEKLLAELAPKD
jgi:hypothetical protein